MKMSKKLFAILLAVVLILSVLAVGASAAGTPTGNEWMTVSITTDKGADSYEAGEDVTVSVTIACNYNVPTFRFPILYDADVLEVKTGVAAEAYGTCATAGSISSNRITDGSCTPESYDGNWGCFLVQWVANVENGAIGCINNPDGELSFSFTLRTKAGSTGKTGTIIIPAESDKLYYQAIEDPTIATSFYYLSAETCTMTFNSANVTVASADVALIPNAAYNSTAVIDEDNLLVYGLQFGIMSTAQIREFVAATGGATVQATPSENGYGTGTTIDLRLGGTTVKSYDVLVYGDLNGDCDLLPSDITAAANYYNMLALIPSDLVFMALDIEPDGNFDSTDFMALTLTYASVRDIDQTTPPFVA